MFVVAWAMAAVVVRRRRIRGQIDIAEFGVGAHGRPHGDLPRIAPGIALPRVVSGFAWLRHGVKRPQQLARAHVVGTNPSRDLFLGDDQRRDRRRRDDHIAHHDRRRLHGIGECVQVVARSAIRARQAGHQVDPAVHAEVRDWAASEGIDRHQIAVAGAPVDAGGGAVAPVGHAALIPPGGHGGGASLVAPGIERPPLAAGGRIERRAHRRGRVQIEQPAHHQRRGLEVGDERRLAVAPARGVEAREFGEHVRRRTAPLTTAGGADAQMRVRRWRAPRHPQAADVVAGDLRERRVLRAGEIAAVGRPLAGRGAARRILCGGEQGRDGQHTGAEQHQGSDARGANSHAYRHARGLDEVHRERRSSVRYS